jgi:hypothetical protein
VDLTYEHQTFLHFGSDQAEMDSSCNDMLEAAEKGEVSLALPANGVEKSPTLTSSLSFLKLQSPLSSQVFSKRQSFLRTIMAGLLILI